MPARSLRAALAAFAPFVATLAALPAQAFVNYESGPVHAARVAPDGSRLFVADTVGGHLQVFDLADPTAPVLVDEIPVGLEPVSVHPRTRDEVWVCNQMSDSVSIVDIAIGAVVDTLRVVDEPSDVVFANGRAFVSAATMDRVLVFDVATRASVGTVLLLGKDPRALAVSPNGAKVYAVIQRSGNGTTLVPEFFAPSPPLPLNYPLVPAAPSQSIIVRATDPTWAFAIPYTLPDHDVAEIDAATLGVTRYFDAVGTTNTGIAVDPATGDLWVTNTDARNLVRFEPSLRGHAIDSRVTRITTGAAPSVVPIDLNPGINYAQLPNPQALQTALAEPFGIAIDAAAGRIYVAAQGTDRVGVLDLTGGVIDRIEIGNAATTRDKRGPRALALHPSQPVLYVLNRLSDTLAVIDTQSRAVLHELPIATWDPMPQQLREGRKFLYDSKLAGNGTMSCAACHIDGDADGLAWDLGDRGGAMQNAPSQPLPFSLGLQQFHPMKGPMVTQTLKGLDGVGPLHWRGDRSDFQAFNVAFADLMGGSQLAPADMNDFAAFGTSIAVPPNPNQQLDRSYRTTPANNNEAAGFAAFTALAGNIQLYGQVACATCHALPATGTNGMVVASQVLLTPQQMKVAQLRSVYRKEGFVRAFGPTKAGFGFTHDGVVDTLTSFINLTQFNSWPSATKDDIVTFLRVFDTGTAPTVGHQTTVHSGNANSGPTASTLALLTARAAAGDIDLAVRGVLDGRRGGLLYDPVAAVFRSDLTGEGPFALAQLVAKATAGDALLTFVGVPPGSGERLARDRDLDLIPDGDEAAFAYGTSTAGCAGDPTLRASSEPRAGNGQFALVAGGAAAGVVGVRVVGFAATALPLLGVDLLVDPTSAVSTLVFADTHGGEVTPFSLAPGSAHVGLALRAQILWLDPCGPQGIASTRGLGFTIVP
ncbi:MAG: beta-propeller fold lactonase family protein [Planctomycetes bacterium]|nr:beta-propeller fold lactonase family protein [Planctomycetota bacterium]